MSESEIDMSREQLGEYFVRLSQNGKIHSCERLVSEVADFKFERDPTESEIAPVEAVRGEVEKMREATVEIFHKAERIRDINLYMRQIFFEIASDLDFRDKIYRPEARSTDNLSTLYNWQKLFFTVNLPPSEFEAVDHDYIIPILNIDRNDVEHGPEGENNRPDLVGITVITWYALEEVLTNWLNCQRFAHHGRLDEIEDPNQNYGYIHKVEDQTIAWYNRGIIGPNLPFEKSDINFLPRQGDVVVFETTTRDGNQFAVNIDKYENS